MKTKLRSIFGLLEARIAEKKPLIQIMIGPRQVGKTTLVKAVLNHRGVYGSADSPVPLDHSAISEWWEQALHTPDKILVIDEVQKVREWSEVIKQLWDANPHSLKVVLTGSSALLVEKGLRETLAGRFELIRVEHWNFHEAKQIFGMSLRDYIGFGCYPGAVAFLKDIHRWADYVRDSIVEPAIGRDLLQLHPIDHPALLRQIFGVAVSMPAHVISLQKMQGQLQGKGTLPTIQHYMNLLAEAFLVTAVEKYSPIPIRTRRSTPKMIVHDNGLIRAFERPVTDTVLPEPFGRYLENAVGARFIEAGWETYYWKDRDLEVDFVVLGPGGEKWAVEVKSAKTSMGEMKGLLQFCQLYPEFKPVLVSYVGQTIEGVQSVALEDVLSMHRY